jgi:RNase P/RNase MRP subunit POP5
MREKKRYLAFEIITEKPFLGEGDKILMKRINELLGFFQSADAGIMRVKYDYKSQRGLLRIDRSFVDHVRACFVMIKHLNCQPVLLRTLRVSGMLNKAGECLKLCED